MESALIYHLLAVHEPHHRTQWRTIFSGPRHNQLLWWWNGDDGKKSKFRTQSHWGDEKDILIHWNERTLSLLCSPQLSIDKSGSLTVPIDYILETKHTMKIKTLGSAQYWLPNMGASVTSHDKRQTEWSWSWCDVARRSPIRAFLNGFVAYTFA